MASKRKTPKRKPAKRMTRKPAKPAPVNPGALAMQAAADSIKKTADQLAIDHARRRDQMAVDHAKRKIDKLTGGMEL